MTVPVVKCLPFMQPYLVMAECKGSLSKGLFKKNDFFFSLTSLLMLSDLFYLGFFSVLNCVSATKWR